MRRPVLVASLLYAALALLLVAPGLAPGRVLSSADYLYSTAPWTELRPDGVRFGGANGENADAVSVFEPFAAYNERRLGSVPLWNPHQMGGRPYIANAQSAVASPFSLPGYALPDRIAPALTTALKLFTAALGTFLLAQALGIAFGGALLAGLAFGFGLWMVTWSPWPLASVWALMPWLLWATDRAIRRPGAASVAVLAGIGALGFLAGHPESSFHAGAVAFLFGLVRLSRRPGGARGRPAAAMAVGLAAGGTLAAAALLPFFELLLGSGDLSDRAGKEPVAASRKYLLEFALPEYWGRPTKTTSEPFINARAYYLGALPLLLAGLSLLRPSRERVAVAGIAALSVAIAIGVPPFFEIVTALPGFAQAHNTRLGAVACLAVALLAGWGLGDLLAGARPGRWAAAGLAAVLLAPFLPVIFGPDSDIGTLRDAAGLATGLADFPAGTPTRAIWPVAAGLQWAAMGGAAALLIWLAARGRLAPAALAACALALTAADLVRAGMGQNPAIPVAHARPPETGAMRHLLAQRPARFTGAHPAEGLTPLPSNAAMRYGLYDARGYDYPVERRYDTFWRAGIAPDAAFIPPTSSARTDEPALRALGLLGVKDLLQQHGDPPLTGPGVELAYGGPDARVYTNRHAQPRAWVVDRQRVVDGERAALRGVLAAGFDPRAEALVERPVAGIATGGGGAGPGAGSAELVRYEPERIELAVTSRAPGLVVLSDVHYPGWRARVDGRRVPIARVDYLLRGMAVPAGRHTVELRYEPASWRIGWIVSLLTALALAGAWALSAVRRRRQAGGTAPA